MSEIESETGSQDSELELELLLLLLDYSRYYGTRTGCESSARVSLSRVIGGLGRCFKSLHGQPSCLVDIRLD